MTSIIDKLDQILTNLKTEVEGVLTDYKVSVFLRFPTESDAYPIALIVPIRVISKYAGGLSQLDEYATAEIELHLIVKTPFDYSGSTLLTDLDTVLEKLRTLRYDETKWRELQYKGGIEFSYSPISNWLLQSAVISLSIEE